MTMTLLSKIIVFVLCSIFFVKISKKSLGDISSHGFYRFFAFEGILILLLLNESLWFIDPFSVRQLISWLLLALSPLIVLSGFYDLKKTGGHTDRESKTNLYFENTEKLVTAGIYKYIRHPMYSSLLLLNWGILLKDISILTLTIGGIVSIFLCTTAKIEEKENIDFWR